MVLSESTGTTLPSPYPIKGTKVGQHDSARLSFLRL